MTPAPEVEEQPRPPRISVVIVSLDRGEMLRASLTELGDEHQVIVVDNGSSDGSQQLDQEFPHVRFSKLPRNFGLTKALNIGIRASDGEYILLLHDDVRITGADVTRLANFLEHRPDVGAVCPLLVSSSGEPLPQVGSALSPANTRLKWQTPPTDSAELAVDCVTGAAIMLRASFLRALRQIDERYGTFGSAAEICAQVRRANRKTIVLTHVRAVHGSAPSPVRASVLEGDRVAGTAAFLGKHHGFSTALTYRIKSVLASLPALRFKVLAGALSGSKIDGTH